MSKVYHVLLSRFGKGANWVIEFGSFDREDVVAEREDYRDHDHRASNLKIITVRDARQASVDAAVAKLNAPKTTFVAPEDRGMTTEEFEAHHGRKVEVDDILASWRRLPSPSKKREG